MKNLNTYILESFINEAYDKVKKLKDIELALAYEITTNEESINYLKSFIKTDKNRFIEKCHELFLKLSTSKLSQDVFKSDNFGRRNDHSILINMWGPLDKRSTRKQIIDFFIPIALFKNIKAAAGIYDKSYTGSTYKGITIVLQPLFEELLGAGSFDEFKKYF